MHTARELGAIALGLFAPGFSAGPKPATAPSVHALIPAWRREVPNFDIPVDGEGRSMRDAKRKVVDCRQFPSGSGCTVAITAGTEGEVLKVAVRHAVEEHGHQNTPELREQIRSLLKDE